MSKDTARMLLSTAVILLVCGVIFKVVERNFHQASSTIAAESAPVVMGYSLEEVVPNNIFKFVPFDESDGSREQQLRIALRELGKKYLILNYKTTYQSRVVGGTDADSIKLDVLTEAEIFVRTRQF